MGWKERFFTRPPTWAGLVLAGALTLLTALATWPAAAVAQGPDGYSTYYVAPSCTGVPAPCFTDVQAAVDAADDPGDVIKVATGTYSGINHRGGLAQVVYISKAVTIRGGYAPGNWDIPDPADHSTTLDAQGRGRVVYIAGAISPALEGLRITGGNATGLGGGLWSYDGTGGGVYVVTATATIRHCTIYQNTASRAGWGGGGGVHLLFSPSTLSYNAIYSNTASTGDWGEGGGVGMSASNATLTGNVIQGNTGTAAAHVGLGGGLYIEGGPPFTEGGEAAILRNNVVWGNTASHFGKGLGGGLFVGLGNKSLLVNTVIGDNFSGPTPDSGGGGVAVEVSFPRFVHTTIARNTSGDGSGVYVLDSPRPYSTVFLTNTILVSHTVGITVPAGHTALLDGVLWYDNAGANTSGAGNIAVTDEFAGDPAFAPDGYHLLPVSAAVDRGVDAGVTDDVDEQDRPHNDLPDLGADEWHPPNYFYLPLAVGNYGP